METQPLETQQFRQAQTALFARFGINAKARVVDVPAVGGRAHVSVVGSGPPVLLLIGGGAPGALWAPLMAGLNGFTLYAVDRPGFGLTDAVHHTTTSLRQQAVSFLDQTLDGLGLAQTAVVANSMGGLWASWLALDRPERVTAIVQIGCPATILGTSAPLPMRLLSVRGLGKIMMRMEPPSPRQATRLMERLGDPVDHLPEVRDLMVACQQLDSYVPTWLALLHAALRLRGPRPEVALGADELARINQPVQLIWGDRDPFGTPEVGANAAKMIPDAELHVVPAGHIPWMSQADRIAELATPFLAAHLARPNSAAPPIEA